MTRRHEGRVAVCAGSATGMGAETARRLAAEGASVVIGDVNLAAAKTVVSEIEAAGGKALAVACNIADDAQVRGLIEAAVGAFGGLNMMHVNAGKGSRQDGDAVTTDLA